VKPYFFLFFSLRLRFYLFPSTISKMLLQLNGYPEATTIHLAGSFNDWSPSSLICTRVQDGWRARLPSSESGKVLFKFVVNGTLWFTSQLYRIEQDQVGHINNSILFLSWPLDIVRHVLDWSYCLADSTVQNKTINVLLSVSRR
jgi:hypothetical protein